MLLYYIVYLLQLRLQLCKYCRTKLYEVNVEIDDDF